MIRLVQADVAAAGESDLGHRTPTRFFDFRACDALLSESRHLSAQVVTHQVDLVPPIVLGRVHGYLRRRQGEDELIVPGIHRRKAENVPEECTIGSRMLAVDDDVGAEDHCMPPVRPSSIGPDSLISAPGLIPPKRANSRHFQWQSASSNPSSVSHLT